jgi:hypothetical protein
MLGRSQKILMLEVAVHHPGDGALLLIKRGGRALRLLWFPFFFMIFMVPLPSEFVAR